MIDPVTRRNFSSLVAAAFADGLITEDERLVLHRKATEMNIPIRDMHEMIAQGEQGKLSVGIPTSTREREELLEALIDVVCADGRVEAAEHHLLAKFASHLKLTLPDLRLKVRDRMEQRGTRATAIDPQVRATRAAPVPPPSIGLPPAPKGAAPSAPPPPVGPIRLDAPKLVDPIVADVPPVTLQLIRQKISFEAPEDARRYVERTLSVPKEQAERIIQAVLRAFPDLKPPGGQTQARPRR
jgi:uncharacterized tellurite resistance protein B-like protein